MQRMQAHPGARVAPVCAGRCLIRTAERRPDAALLPLAALAPHVVEGTLVFLGLEEPDQAPVYSAACGAQDGDAVAALAGDGGGQVLTMAAALYQGLSFIPPSDPGEHEQQ